MAEQHQLFAVRNQRQPGWFFIDNEIVDKYGARLGAYGLAVYAVLSRRCKQDTQHVDSLSQRDIAAILGISQDRVRKSLDDLGEIGLVRIDVPKHPSPGVISTITLLNVKETERRAFSSAGQLNAARSPNKEEKKKTETEKQNHACGALNADLALLEELKAELAKLLTTDEWQLWVRPLNFQRRMGGSTLLLGLPPSGKIIEAAQARLAMMDEILRSRGCSVRLTRYPDEYHIERMREEFPDQYRQQFGWREASR